MSTLKIREYSRLGQGYPGGTAQIPQEGGTVVNQTVSFTSSSVQSSAFAADTKFIWIKADVACCISTGINPTATTSMVGPEAAETIFLGVSGGLKIAVIAAA